MSYLCPVTPRAFSAIQNVDVHELSKLSEEELRPLLPCLVRMSLCAPLDKSKHWQEDKKTLLRLLSGVEAVNSLVALLSIDFHILEQDARKEQQLRQKLSGVQTESILISSLQNGLALEFERSDSARRLRLLLSELLFIMAQMRENKQEFYQKSSELFENEVYLEEVGDVLCIAQAELPTLLLMSDVSEALLHVKNGALLLCRLVANVPDSFHEVCSSLISNGEKQDEDHLGGRKRTQALRMLSQMNPWHALGIRAMTVDQCRLPSLAVALTLDYYQSERSQSNQKTAVISDLISFTSGLLLGSDTNVRMWFSQFVRNGQRKRDSGTSMLHCLRTELLKELANALPTEEEDGYLPEDKVLQGSALIRLYCSLKGIAVLISSEDESNLLLKLVTSRPPLSPAGVRFVTLALSMLIACPNLLGTPVQEKRVTEWIKWLLKKEAHFESASAVTTSFGEMLLLIAIHFHSKQLNAISDLVCSTLGMKIPISSNGLSTMKKIFTQEIFTEQVVTQHAVHVPVTPNLNANIPGYLPVHCIHQLLKSRAFTKHKVPIKDWIYKQVCNSITPLHPVLPSLMEVYVTSIILPHTKRPQEHTNEPITEEEILEIFKDSLQSKDYGLNVSGSDVFQPTKMTSQLLLLYYLLLYEDCRLNNMKTLALSNRKVKPYSSNLMFQLPIKYLLQQAQKEQLLYAGLFAPLLRLLATHYPQLCLVEDWLIQEEKQLVCSRKRYLWSSKVLQEAFNQVKTCPVKLVMLLLRLTRLSANQIVPYVDCIVHNLAILLEDGIPRKILEQVKRVWLLLNTVIPRKLHVMTINNLRSKGQHIYSKVLTQDDLTLDPLMVLRCDERVFRCPPLLEIILRILTAFLAASRVFLSKHIQSNPVLEKTDKGTSDAEREELKVALIAAQESAAVQILLECCLPREQEKVNQSQLSDLREIRCLICSHLHQMFIADPTLAKLVHFQGYPSQLIPIAVAGIPSMHICLDFIPELLSQPQLEKQIFAIELTSHLCLQYVLPKSLTIARLAVNVMITILNVLPSDAKPEFFQPTLPAVVRICQAFPPLCEDVTTLLLQLGRICLSHVSVVSNQFPICTDLSVWKTENVKDKEFLKNYTDIAQLPTDNYLSQAVQKTFVDICKIAMQNKNMY